MIEDLWPTYGLSLKTPRLRLQLPREDELAQFAHLAGVGVHRPGERPFLTPWTDGSPENRARSVLREHWSQLADWKPDNWQLGLGVFNGDNTPLGMITVRARRFRVVREVTTFSWLGVAHHGQGYGTEARRAALTLAFDYLGAESAVSEAFQDNAASQGVSRKLGYRPDGISRDARGDEVLVSDRLRLNRSDWTANECDVVVQGLGACLHMFGC